MSENTNCILCGDPTPQTLFWASDIRHRTPGEFAWNACRKCGLVYLSPRPATYEMGIYYPPDYALFRSVTEQRRWWQFPWMQERDLNQRCRAAMTVGRLGRVLDVGCGTGEFLASMARRGWQTVGVEPSAEPAAFAREQLGLQIVTGGLQDLQGSDFDVITLWTVLEHLHNPLHELQAARRLLRQDGILIISVPDINSVDARLFGQTWVGFDTPRHLFAYSTATLDTLLARAGFTVWRTEHFQADYYTFLASLEPWLARRLGSRRLRAWIERLLHLPGLRLLTWPLFWAINALKMGCIVTVYARPISE